MINAKNYKEILLSFPGEGQQRIAESTEKLKEEIYKSGEVPAAYSSTSYKHQPYEALVTAMHGMVDNFLKRVRADMDSNNLAPEDVDFLLTDVLERMQSQVDYARSTISAIHAKKTDEGTP
jgi:hypothetical protein